MTNDQPTADKRPIVVKWGRSLQHAVGNIHDYEGLCGARPKQSVNFVQPSAFRGVVTCPKCVKILEALSDD